MPHANIYIYGNEVFEVSACISTTRECWINYKRASNRVITLIGAVTITKDIITNAQIGSSVHLHSSLRILSPMLVNWSTVISSRRVSGWTTPSSPFGWDRESSVSKRPYPKSRKTAHRKRRLSKCSGARGSSTSQRTRFC